MARHWYVLKTKPHAEDQVVAVLDRRDIEVYLPKIGLGSTKRPKERQEPLFPGYLFAHIDVTLDEWLKARSAPGVAYVLGCDGFPSAVPDEVVLAIRGRLEACGGVLQPRLAKGDRVVIKSGPLAGLEAVFDAKLSGAGRSRVLLSILGRLTPMEISIYDLQRAG
jgi:transcriptional antiterminator RfaH